MKRIAVVLQVFLMLSTLAQAQSTKVLIQTDKGDITVMLYDDTPLHKENFISLVNQKFYDGILFHRVMKNFMIQAGDPKSKTAQPKQALGNTSEGDLVPAEFRHNRIHKRGALAAARKGGPQNPQKMSSGSQFYIVEGRKWSDMELNSLNARRMKKFTEEEFKLYKEVGGYPSLDFEYTVFGEVTEGMDVVEAIAKARGDGRNRPLQDIKIISARIIK